MWDCVVAAVAAGGWIDLDQLDARPGGVIRVSHPRDVQFLQKQPVSDCHGCGAPLKAHIRHCEYCRREK